MKVKMSQDEKTSAPEFYLKHKDYFDEKLITVLDNTHYKYLKEKDKNDILLASLILVNGIMKKLVFYILLLTLTTCIL